MAARPSLGFRKPIRAALDFEYNLERNVEQLLAGNCLADAHDIVQKRVKMEGGLDAGSGGGSSRTRIEDGQAMRGLRTCALGGLVKDGAVGRGKGGEHRSDERRGDKEIDLRNLSAYSQRGVLTAHGPMLASNWLQRSVTKRRK